METKLHGWHIAHGARMVDFGGWDMPVQYENGPREEHVRVREAAGLFDIDHMGRFEVGGPQAVDFLQKIQTWDVTRIVAGRAHYGMILDDNGCVVDDIFVYHRADGWLLVVNAGNRPKDWDWLQSHREGMSVTLRDASAETCMMALQGPAARAVLQPLCAGADLDAIRFHHIRDISIGGASSVLCTTGYTGEPGYELMVPAAAGQSTWARILETGAKQRLIPCGLAARDSLRAEACLPLYGHELDDTVDPLCAGLARAAVSLEGHDFIGRKALAARALGKLPRVLIGFEMVEPGVPRSGYGITRGGARIGRVTTGLFSPSTGKYVGMGYVDTDSSEPGTDIAITIRESDKAARVVERPFYTSPHWAPKGR